MGSVSLQRKGTRSEDGQLDEILSAGAWLGLFLRSYYFWGVFERGGEPENHRLGPRLPYRFPKRGSHVKRPSRFHAFSTPKTKRINEYRFIKKIISEFPF